MIFRIFGLTIFVNRPRVWLWAISPSWPFKRIGLLSPEDPKPAMRCSGFYILGLEVTW